MTIVLIVDDEQDMRNLIEMMLNNSDIETFTAVRNIIGTLDIARIL